MKQLIRFIVATTVLFASPQAFALDHYEFDKAHTYIAFYINHLGYSKVLGLFSNYDGTLQFDLKHPQDSKLDFTLKPSGIHTSSEILDHVLQGENFFNSSKYPDIHFVSNSIKITGDNTGAVTGDLTMLGVTKPITLHVILNKADYQPVTNFYVAGFSAHADLKRSDFGMNYAIPMVGDDVHIDIETETVDQERKNAEKLHRG